MLAPVATVDGLQVEVLARGRDRLDALGGDRLDALGGDRLDALGGDRPNTPGGRNVLRDGVAMLACVAMLA
jgi:hypothetical protein